MAGRRSASSTRRSAACDTRPSVMERGLLDQFGERSSSPNCPRVFVTENVPGDDLDTKKDDGAIRFWI